jgi:hypothetical protein
MPADQGLVDSVANDNTKAIAGKIAAVAAESFQDYAQSRSRTQLVADIAFAQWAVKANDMDPKEALSLVKGMGAADPLPEVLGKLGTLIAQLQQVMKGAQSTPPETATGK